jgi:hypothetical protein
VLKVKPLFPLDRAWSHLFARAKLDFENELMEQGRLIKYQNKSNNILIAGGGYHISTASPFITGWVLES